jgi:hypothetical protein
MNLSIITLFVMINTPLTFGLGSHHNLKFKNVFGSGKDHENKIKS